MKIHDRVIFWTSKKRPHEVESGYIVSIEKTLQFVEVATDNNSLVLVTPDQIQHCETPSIEELLTSSNDSIRTVLSHQHNKENHNG